jgi:hypothetical protein
MAEIVNGAFCRVIRAGLRAFAHRPAAKPTGHHVKRCWE